MLLVAFAVGSAVSCRELPDLRQRACGNGVVDPGEDCDTFAPAGQRCGRAATPVACRFECSLSPVADTPVCPTGWQCGTDDICRAATGSFVPMATPIEAAVERVLLGDFQGTGRAAVLGLGSANSIGAAYARLFFLQDDGTPVESTLLGFPVISPVLGDLSGDGRDDFVFTLIGGLGVMLGQPSRELRPVAYPLLTVQAGATTRVLPVRPHPLSVLDEDRVLLLSVGETGRLLALSDSEHVIANLPHPHERMLGEPVLADVIRDPSAPCGELVFTYLDDPNVWMVQPCNADGTWAGPETSLRKAATLPSGFTVETGAFVADLDGDQELDLLVGSEASTMFVAFGCGDGRFCANKEDPTTAGWLLPIVGHLAAACEDEPMEVARTPIAVGDVNGDGIADVVTSSEILVVRELAAEASTVRVGVCPAATKLVGQWTTARIVDLNRDGRPDVIAGSSFEPDLEFYAGTGLDRLNMTRLTTPAPVRHLSVGDFDGDQVPDLAAALAGVVDPSSGVRTDALAIAYGRVQHAPEPIVIVAAFQGIAQVVAAHFDYADAIEELGVVAVSEEGLQTITVFLSNGGRRLLAPFGLVGSPTGPGPDAAVEGSPLSVALGDFDADGNLDIASLALPSQGCSLETCQYRLWVTRSEGQARLAQSVFSDYLPGDFTPIVASETAGMEVAAFMRVADLDGDGVDDPVLLTPWKHDPNQTVLGWAKMIHAQETLVFGTVEALSHGPIRMTAKSQPIVWDLDDDGHLDVMVLSGGATERQVLVAWGSTGVDLLAPVPIELPANPSGFAMIQADTDVLKEVLVVAREGVYLLGRDPAAPRVWSTEKLADMAGGTSVAVRDIDGDGIEDFAIADALGVRLYRGRGAVP